MKTYDVRLNFTKTKGEMFGDFRNNAYLCTSQSLISIYGKHNFFISSA